MLPETLAPIESGTAKKCDVLSITRIAGIMANKKTSDLTPLCHPLALTRVAVEFESQGATSSCAADITCIATAETTGHKGVEIEAPMSVQIALLTINDVKLMEKQGESRGVSLLRPTLEELKNRCFVEI